MITRNNLFTGFILISLLACRPFMNKEGQDDDKSPYTISKQEEVLEKLQGDWILNINPDEKVRIAEDVLVYNFDTDYPSRYSIRILEDSFPKESPNILFQLFSAESKEFGFYFGGISKNNFSLMSDVTGQPLIYYRMGSIDVDSLKKALEEDY